MKILVLGANGTLGKEICSKLRIMGYEFEGFDVNLSKNSETRYTPIPPIQEIIKMNNLEIFFNSVEKQNDILIINSTGILINEENFLDDFEYLIGEMYMVNLVFPVLLTEYCLKFGNIRLIHILSSSQWFITKKFKNYSISKKMLYEYWKNLKSFERKKIKIVIPSGFKSNIQKSNHFDYKFITLMTAEYVANEIVQNLEKRKSVQYIGLRSKIFRLLYVLIPNKIGVMMSDIVVDNFLKKVGSDD